LETNFITMLKCTTLLTVVSLAIPLSGATITGTNELKLTFNPTQDVTIVATQNEDADLNVTPSGPPGPCCSAFGAIANASDDPAFTLLAKNEFQAYTEPGSALSFDMFARAEGLTLRNSGRFNANVLINFVLIMNGTAEGPGTALFSMRNLVETRLDANDWATIFDASIDANSPGALTVADYCVSPNTCSGQLSVTVPVNSVVRVRSIATSEGLVSEPEVPEPSALLLSGAGLSALLLFRRRFGK
jgi:hypothetical protein